jgi:hypothetical protein
MLNPTHEIPDRLIWDNPTRAIRRWKCCNDPGLSAFDFSTFAALPRTLFTLSPSHPFTLFQHLSEPVWHRHDGLVIHLAQA